MEKKLVWIGMFSGSLIGGWIPSIWGDDFFSIPGILLSVIGGLAGIWLGYKLSRMF